MLVSAPSFAANEASISDPLGHYRLLIMCLPHDRDVSSKKTILSYSEIDWAGFEERDLLLVEVSPYSMQVVMPHKNILDTRLRDRVNCGNELELVLIGKDTGVKVRWKKDYSQEDLFNRIDAMPMRQFEMQFRGGR